MTNFMNEQMQVMLDLETLGNKPGSVIVAVGAVKFGAGKILEEFYERVDAQSCVSIGLQMDVSTVLWWMKQSDEARQELSTHGEHINDVLVEFRDWLGDSNAAIWGNGAAFDNVILSDAYAAAGMVRPWKYTNDRCYRTVKSLCPDIPCPHVGMHHHALDDARSQALHLMSLLEERPEVESVPASKAETVKVLTMNNGVPSLVEAVPCPSLP